MSVVFAHTYEELISFENLLGAWREFLKGKRNKQDVQLFQYRLSDNLLTLHHSLKGHTYAHAPYHAFRINDPKPRQIHKATVRDRLLHHALYRKLYPFFDHRFIEDSYSCRKEKGAHRALNRFRAFAWEVSKNHTCSCWVLKCDVKKFFASVDHEILYTILQRYVRDEHILWLIERVVDSFHAAPGIGLPLGNLTSQLFVNIYMNEFDQWMKHALKSKYYLRYADDFVLLSCDRGELERALPRIEQFLREKLRLTLHPDKISIRTIASGVDFLGWVHFPDHRVLRTTARRRALRNIARLGNRPEVMQSYLGLMKYGNTEKLRQRILRLS